MLYVREEDRNQMEFTSLDSEVDPDSTARLIDAFVESLDLSKYGFKEASEDGRPAYNPKGLLKLYIYGNRKNIRSSRKLAESCRTNLEVRWMLGKVTPDFRTISDFRKNNIESMKKIFHEFNRRISESVEWGYSAVDGSKIQANNSKDNNFTKNKLDDRIKWLDEKTNDYFKQINEIDEEEGRSEHPGELTREELETRLKEAQERLERYRGYQKIMEETGASQLSITDMDARLMKDKDGFTVSYNAQTVVDSETHLIRECEVTNQVTDHGLIAPVMENIRRENQDEIMEIVADKGYEKSEDLVKCLEEGIIPNVIPQDGKKEYELEVPYEAAEDIDTTSRKAEDLKKCLHAGQIPEAYKDVISGMEVEEIRRKVKEEPAEEKRNGTAGTAESQKERPYGTDEEMKARAKEGYFVRDPEKNLVYCPAGEILRQKSLKNNGNIRYANKTACRKCPYRDKCFKGKGDWKEIDFTKDCLEKPCRGWQSAEIEAEQSVEEKEKAEVSEESRKTGKQKSKWHYEKIKRVKFRFRPDQRKMTQRLCLSEHPFATMKRFMGGSYFLLKGLKKAEGEFSLLCLGYNIERAKNLLGFEQMMKLMARG